MFIARVSSYETSNPEMIVTKISTGLLYSHFNKITIVGIPRSPLLDYQETFRFIYLAFSTTVVYVAFSTLHFLVCYMYVVFSISLFLVFYLAFSISHFLVCYLAFTFFFKSSFYYLACPLQASVHMFMYLTLSS